MTKKAKVENYTAEQAAKIVADYKANPTKETVAALAAEMGKSPRSIVAKLVNLDVYQKPEKAATEGEAKETKGAIVAQIEKACGVVVGTFESLESATKKALTTLRDKLNENAEAFSE